MTYSEYLKTDHWKSISSKRKDIDGNKCYCCGCSENLEVHHVRYDGSWFETEVKDLVTLCKDCHVSLHRIKERIEHRLRQIKALEKNDEWLTSDKQYYKNIVSKYGWLGSDYNSSKILVQLMWKKNIFPSSQVHNCCEKIVNETISKSLQIQCRADCCGVCKYLALVKDCYIANKSPTFNQQRRKYKVLSGEKYR